MGRRLNCPSSALNRIRHLTSRCFHPPFEYQIIFAVSPLLVLGYILYTGFDDVDEEKKKRSTKTDFTLEGHDE